MKFTTWRSFLYLPLTLILLLAPLHAGDTWQIDWVSSFEEALKQAQLRHVPILVIVNSDSLAPGNRDANERMALECYRDPAVVKASRQLVCLVASFGHHVRNDQEGKHICPRFGRVLCEDHSTVADFIQNRYLKDSGLESPQHLILDPGGKLLDHHRFELEAGSLVRIIEGAVAGFQEGEAKRIIKSLKGRSREANESAFSDALKLLQVKGVSKRLHRAAIGYLKSLKRNSSVRRTAWDAIEKNGSEEALSLLLPALQEKSPGIRREALAIFASTESYPSFLDDLAARVRKEKSEQVLVALVKALEIYSAKFNAAVDPLNRLVVSRNKNIQILATLAAAWPGNTTIFAELLKRAKGSANPAVRSAAIVGLARMDAKKALPVLKRIRRKKGSKSSLSRVLDLAIARLEGDDSVSKDLDCERDRLKSEAGSGDDRENEAWRNRTERRRKPPGRF